MTQPTCAVVGAGLTGLVTASRLAAAGWRVTIFERYPEAGGLVAMFTVGGEPLECFYHHIFTSDTDFVALADELGLGAEIEWLPSRMGIWSKGRLWDFGTPASLLHFGAMSWVARARFAFSTLRLRHSPDVRPFEGVTARQWIIDHAGQQVYDTVWGPLLAQKFSDMADRVSMAWLWGKVYLRGRSRSSSGLGERLGYMRGGFGRVIDELVTRVRAAGVRLELANPVKRLTLVEGGIEVTFRTGSERFEHVVFTAAPAELARVGADSLPEDARQRLADLPATAALCVVLELDRSLSPYYWLNIADRDFPFGGVIEHTNYIPRERYDGRVIVYISKYLFPTHPLWAAPEAEVWATYRPFLQRINPQFSDAWVLGRHHFKAAYAQPVIGCHYPSVQPPFETAMPGLHHACMAQIYPEDRGQNYAVRLGNRAAAALLGQPSS